jgi:methionine salvage enolase-phosphatase E1
MARPKKKSVELNTDSFVSMAQEAYNELVEQRSTAIRQINENKKKVDVEDIHDLGTMSKVNTDLLKLVDSTIDKKISILKMMGGYIFKGGATTESVTSGTITPEDIEMIQTLMGDKNGDNDDGTYKLKD